MSGLFGCVSKRECVADIFYGTDYHSHLGTRRGGMAMYDGENFDRSIHSIENSNFRNKFEDELPRFKESKMGIGVISDAESQPVTLTSHLGRFSVVTSSKLTNVDALTDELLKQKVNFAELSNSEINPTELIAILVSRADSIKEGIELVQEKVQGSCTLLLLSDRGIYVSRDKFGRTPIVLGKNEDGYVAATESSSFTNLEYKFVRELGPGEIVFITPDGVEELKKPGEKLQTCSFLWIYYGYPSSTYEGINVEDARYRCGCTLARRDENQTGKFDLAAGIPDSGVGHAIGYANCAKLPFKRPFVKYTPTWPRSFMPQYQSMRSLVAKMKLIPNEALTKGANIVLLDDSIVRGTQLKDNIKKLVEAEVASINIRVASPPLVYPCEFLNFSASRSSFDLFTRRVIKELEQSEDFSDELLRDYATPDTERYEKLVEYMRKAIGADTLKFQHLGDMVKAIGLPKEKLCTHCWDRSSYVVSP